ncbi:MAG: antibiotic biosynthesis monooxygenase [Zoogloea sp.]|jgi:quinol monooxygenase YgiN|nr:antibiotic biosynthesis monooxygenase [Zoogloea sp.]
MTIAVTARIEVDPAHLAAFMEAAGPAIRATRQEPGCRLYAFARDFQQENLIWVSEEWTSDAALTEHLATPHISEFLARIAKLGLLSMEARKYEVSHVGTVTPPPAA